MSTPLSTIWKRSMGGIPVAVWLALLFAALIGYWPLTTGLFGLKNDAYVYFLPSRFAISDAIQQGQWPWWTPYYYMGHPLHADMQSGAWNPIVLGISLFTRYNLSWLQAETVLYIFLAGMGMYKLVERCTSSTVIRVLIAVSYMFSGFIIDTAQITVWTGSAAFLPFVLHYFLRITGSNNIQWAGLGKLSISLYLLLTAGYPSFLIVAIEVLTVLYVYLLLTKWRLTGRRELPLRQLLSLALAGLLFIGLSMPALYSYWDFLPLYQRAGGTSLAEANQNPLDIFSLLSLLFPFSVTREHSWLHSNPTARSLFMGLIPVLSFVVFRKKPMTRTEGFILLGVLFFFLFSLGDATPIRSWCYHWLPGMNYFRHPGTMRVFAMIGLLYLAARNLDYMQHLPALRFRQTWRVSLWLLLLASTGCCLFAAWKARTWFSEISHLSLQNRANWKSAYEHIGFYPALLLDAALLSCLLIALLYSQKKRLFYLPHLLAVQCLHLLLSAQWTIPFTMVTQVSPNGINAFMAHAPHDMPVNGFTQPVSLLTSLEESYHRQYGAASVYGKQVCWIEPLVNPSIPNRLRDLDSLPTVRHRLFQFPVFYPAVNKATQQNVAQDAPYFMEPNAAARIDSIYIEPNDWHLLVTTATETRLCVLQNYNANWQVWIDGKKSKPARSNHAFMSVQIPAGKHLVHWHYEPGFLKEWILVSLLVLVMLMLLTCWPGRRFR